MKSILSFDIFIPSLVMVFMLLSIFAAPQDPFSK